MCGKCGGRGDDRVRDSKCYQVIMLMYVHLLQRRKEQFNACFYGIRSCDSSQLPSLRMVNQSLCVQLWYVHVLVWSPHD